CRPSMRINPDVDPLQGLGEPRRQLRARERDEAARHATLRDRALADTRGQRVERAAILVCRHPGGGRGLPPVPTVDAPPTAPASARLWKTAPPAAWQRAGRSPTRRATGPARARAGPARRAADRALARFPPSRASAARSRGPAPECAARSPRATGPPATTLPPRPHTSMGREKDPASRRVTSCRGR